MTSPGSSTCTRARTRPERSSPPLSNITRSCPDLTCSGPWREPSKRRCSDMAEERFIDYFDYADLDPAATREFNYSRLNKLHIDLKDKHSKDAQLAEEIISKAMAIFRTQEPYDAYRVRWEQRRLGKAPQGPHEQPAAASAGQKPPAGTPPKSFKAALLE